MLPKGIVVNTGNIYKEVAGFSVVPAEKVREYWHVYTTTHKRLKDPTACRLENFWWHVWGSNRMLLNGTTLAKLYEDISIGPTVVTLKGPPDRWEGPELLPEVRHVLVTVQVESSPTPSPPSNPLQTSTLSSSGLRVLSSSASRAPPSHPILKKTSTPSNSRPKPTARFVSPVHSDNENEIPSSGSTAATASEAPAHLPSPAKKKMTSVTKRFVASTAASKRRHSLPRRQSSDHGPRESGPSGGLRHAVPLPVTPIAEDDLEQAVISPENISPLQEPLKMSEKARGKQPAIPRRPVSKLNGLTKHNTFCASQSEQQWPMQSSTIILPQAQSLVDLNGHTRRRDSASTRSTLTVGSLQSNSSGDIPCLSRSQSYTPLDTQKKPTYRLPSTGLLSSATALTSKVDATGVILDQSGQSTVPEAKMAPQKYPSHHGIVIERQPSILDAHFTPTPPSTAPVVPLGRTKSQLTLLLEREKARAQGDVRSSI